MKKDAWFAAIAALGLCCAAGAYGLLSAENLADPTAASHKSKLTATLPTPPTFKVDPSLLATATEILRQRDPFIAQKDSDSDGGRALNLPKLAPPVRFSDPGERTVGGDAPPAVVTARPVVPAAPVAQNTPQPTRGSLTLRGVFPTSNGGRALVAMPDGQVVNVAVGGVVGGWRVLGIQQGAIRLGRGQRTILLAMPR